jgi:hypothetical protein
MRDLTNPTWIKLKAALFLVPGLLSSGLLFLREPSLEIGLLLVLTIWCFCRFYYFAFYVIEHYVDLRYRFWGLVSFVRYLMSRRVR